jgi:hypothetical protein
MHWGAVSNFAEISSKASVWFLKVSIPMPDSSDSNEEKPQAAKVDLPPVAKARYVNFELRVGWLMLGAALVAFGPIAALAVVASVKNAEALATVALALAIVAFAVQILVFIVQTQTASQQMLHAERLNTQTRELLVEVNTAMGSTQTMVGEQFRDLLRAFVEGASKTAAETGKFDPEQFEQRLMANIQQATQRPSQPEPAASEPPKRAIDSEARRARQRVAERRRETAQLTEFPPEGEGEAIAAQMRELSDDARRRLRAFGEDEIGSREGGVWVGLTNDFPADEELLDPELITPARVSTENGVQEVKRLTKKGRQWASLLVATGDIPKYAADLIPPPAPAEGDDDIPF